MPLGTGQRSGEGWRKTRRILERASIPLVVLVLWQTLTATGIVDRVILPSPLAVLQAGFDLARSGTLGAALGISLLRAGIGLLLGTLIGTALGLISGLSPHGENVVDLPVQMLRTLPVLALVPLFILWFGIGEESKILMVAVATTFPIYINLHAGIRSIDVRYFDLAATLGLSRRQLVLQVLIPGGLQGWLVGLRFASGIAYLVLVVSEQVNATSGLGFLMMDARQSFRTDIVLVGLVVYAVLGVVTDRLVHLLERWLLRWQALRVEPTR